MSELDIAELSVVRTYSVIDVDDQGVAECATLAQAQQAVREHGKPCGIMRNVYVWQYAELHWTPDGSDEWPPPRDEEGGSGE